MITETRRASFTSLNDHNTKRRSSITMCQAINLEKAVQGATATSVLQRITSIVSADKRKAICGAIVFTGVAAFFLLYNFHGGFRRTIQFWKGMGAIGMKYKWTTFRAKYIDRVEEDDELMQQRLQKFHEDAAPVVTQLILKLGGIYLKIGQVLSTVGDIILPRPYVQAFQALQDGVPARDYEEVKSIIESSTGRAMEDIFESFDSKPIGVASIGQAHKATLRKQSQTGYNLDTQNYGPPESEEVIVKIQHADVAAQLKADLNNLEIFIKLFGGSDNEELMHSMRARHENELDFRIEAENLREATHNMQLAGLEPNIVRIPRVRNETGLCTKNVLVMEYLPGASLADSIRHEQDVVARALGHEDGAALRSMISEQMREDLLEGSTNTGSGNKNGNRRITSLFGNTGGPVAKIGARLFRFYANTRERVRNLVEANNEQEQRRFFPSTRRNINLSRVLKTMIHVHGIQLLRNGAFNADPHPGNVLVMPDGKRLGLLDYGMLGRIADEDRITLAKTIVALSKQNKAETARLYIESDYRTTWKKSQDDGQETITDPNILHRLATIQLDAFDLSPITLEDNTKVEMKEFIESFRERRTPSWIEESARLSGLLIGVSAQAARPVSLSKHWASIAKQVLRDNE